MSSARWFKTHITLRLYWKERATTKKLETQSGFGRQIVGRSIPIMCDSAHEKTHLKTALLPLHRSLQFSLRKELRLNLRQKISLTTL
jgi:hypothetical protein